MNELQVFNFNDNAVRTVLINNEPYFVGKDVAMILGYERATKAIQDHVDDEDKDEVPIQDSIGRMQNTPVINESGVYSLVFGSKLPSAKAFKRWVTSEVLPTIRKTGGYHLPSTFSEALRMLATSEEEKEKLLLENKEMKPKAEFYDAVADSKTAIPMDQVAKVLAIENVGRNNLFALLRNMHILQRNNIPYQCYVDRGYFRVVESKFQKPNGASWICIKTLVYQKGVEFIRNKVLNELSKKEKEKC